MADENGLREVIAAPTERLAAERVHALVADAFSRVTRTRARQQTARDFLAGRVRPVYPGKVGEAFARAGSQVVDYRSPQEIMLPLKAIGLFADRWPDIKRSGVGFGRESSATSTRIERLADAVMHDLYPYAQSCDLLFNDGEAATLTVPSIAHWALPVDQYDYLTPAEWRTLPDEEKDLWDWRPNEQGGQYRRTARQFRRDANGTPPWEDGYLGREDAVASAQAITDALEERVRARVPLEISLLAAQQCAPLNPRFQGQRLVLDGLCVRQQFDAVDLYRRGYRWARDGAGLVAAQPGAGGPPVTLEQAWCLDGDGRPYLVQTVDGQRTVRQGDDGEWAETVDLYDAYGLDFLPVGYAYGLHFATVDPDDRVIPYMHALMGGLLLRDKLITTTDYHTGQTAWGGWFVQPSPKVLEAMPELAKKATFEIEPLRATVIPGAAVPAVHAGAGPGVQLLKQMVDLDLAEAGLSPAATGGEGANSAIERAMIARDEKRGMSQIWRGIDGLYAQTATHACRALACLARTRGRNITLNLLTPVPGEQRRGSPNRSTVEVDPDMFGGDYSVMAIRPPQFGDDPALAMFLLDARDRKAATWEMVCDRIGISDPWGTLAQIFAEDFMLNTPEGKQIILEDAARLNLDVERIEEAKLKAQGAVDEQGRPLALAAGVGGGMAPGMAPGMMPNPAMLQSEAGGALPSVTADLGAPAPGGASPAQNQLNAMQGAMLGAGPRTSIARAGGDVSDLGMGG